MGHQNDFDPISKQGFSGALVATDLHSKTLLMFSLHRPKTHSIGPYALGNTKPSVLELNYFDPHPYKFVWKGTPECHGLSSCSQFHSIFLVYPHFQKYLCCYISMVFPLQKVSHKQLYISIYLPRWATGLSNCLETGSYPTNSSQLVLIY